MPKELIITHPIINSENKRCVYKLVFPDGYFYIGSTTNLKTRISGYKSAYKNSIGSVNKLLGLKMLEHGCLCIEILQIVSPIAATRIPEDLWIKKHAHSPLFLNRSRSAFNNSGAYKSQLNQNESL